MPLVRVSVYLPWRPADVYCDGVEYSSYQYGLHQYWISHSGLAGCPPAAYSNIVSRIVIIGAELWPKLQNILKENQKKKKIFAAIFPQKPLSSSFSKCVLRGVMRMRWNRLRVRRASLALDCVKKKKKKKRDGGKMMVSETQARPKTGMKACLDLWYMVLFFFLLSPFSSFHPHTYTWESRQLMCCLWWQREAYINSQKTMMKGLSKRRKNGYKTWYQKGRQLMVNTWDGARVTRHRGVEGWRFDGDGEKTEGLPC